jgi:hypothetical protein
MRLVPASTACLRDQLSWLRGRYDEGAIAPAIFSVIKKIEVELAWREHHAKRTPHDCADTSDRPGWRSPSLPTAPKRR